MLGDSTYGLIYNMLWSIALNPSTMIIIWFFLLILEFCWSGLRNLVMIVLFPGKLIHLASHILFAHLKGIRMRFIAILGVGRERSMLGVMLSREHPFWVYLFCIFPMFVAIPLYLLFLWMAKIFASQAMFAFLFLWLAVSVFIEGMPSVEDVGTMLKVSIYYEPLSIVFLALTPVVYVLNTYGFGVSIGTYITLVYVLSIMLLSVITRREEVEVYGE